MGERVSRGHIDLDPALLRLGPAGWHGVATDRYGQVLTGTQMPPGLTDWPAHMVVVPRVAHGTAAD